jgi:hypothetical protein
MKTIPQKQGISCPTEQLFITVKFQRTKPKPHNIYNAIYLMLSSEMILWDVT